MISNTYKLKDLRRRMNNGMMTVDECIGKSVKVGFLTLQITGYEETPGDWFPNVWMLTSGKADYRFTPFNGLEKV